jgi:hypothetical protein
MDFWEKVAEVAAHLASVLAAVSQVIVAIIGGWWFISNKMKQRIQFDLGCVFLPLRENPNDLVVELQFIFENKGFVEHRVYDLNVSVHAYESEKALQEKAMPTKEPDGEAMPAEKKELLFSKQLLAKVQLVPEKYNYYFVRPGVRQVITHIIRIPANLSVI